MKKHMIWPVLALTGLMLTTPLTVWSDQGPQGLAPLDATPAVELNQLTTLDLPTAVQIALADNPGLKAAMARVRQAKARVNQARAAYFPRLDANASGSRVSLSDRAYDRQLATARLLNPSATVEDPEDYYRADLTASWTLFDGFERSFTKAAARYGQQSSQAALADARRLLVSAVARAFYTAQLSLENIAIAKADEQFNQRQLTDAQARRRVGTGSLSDVLNFQVRMNQAKTTRINQEYEYTIARFGLAALLGQPESILPDHLDLARLTPETEAELAQPVVDELVTGAMDLRPDIQQTRWAIKQTEAQVGVAKSDYYPSIVVSGAVEGERTEDPSFEGEDWGNRVQVGLSYNLFAGGLTRAKVSEARHRKVELEKKLDDLVLATAKEIRSSVSRVATAQTQVDLQRENVALVTRTRDLVEKEYNAGQGSLVRLNEAQKDLTTARSNLALALVGLRQAWVELKTRSGGIVADYLPSGS